jgi:Skp family chaperone for outer membrane proteins
VKKVFQVENKRVPHITTRSSAAKQAQAVVNNDDGNRINSEAPFQSQMSHFAKQEKSKDLFKLNKNNSNGMLPIPGMLQNNNDYQNTHDQILSNDSESDDKKSQNDRMKPRLKKTFVKKQQSEHIAM